MSPDLRASPSEAKRESPAEHRPGGRIVVEDLGKAYARHSAASDEGWAIRRVSFDVSPGELFVLLGPSGCGKSTLLRMIAGIVDPTEGRIMCEGRPVKGPDRDRGMVFQSIDTPLFEWLTAGENVQFGLRVVGVEKGRRRAEARRLLAMVGLAEHEDKYPPAMSGGMKQRLQIARALSTDPAVLLMDEPFASVDAQTRRILQGEFQRIWQATRKTVVYVTHDIREALLLGQRIAIMSAGPASNLVETYAFDAPYPRDDLSGEFVARYREIDARLAAEVTKAWQRAG